MTPQPVNPLERLEFLKQLKILDWKKAIPPRGNPEARVMIVTHQPSIDDVKEGRVLAGDNGAVIDEVLDLVGIPKEACWFTTIYKFTNKEVKAKDIKEHYEKYFKEEVELLNPDLIITLGAETFKQVYGSNIKSGDWLGMVIEGRHGKMMPTHSPFLVSTIDPLLRKEYVMHFTTAFRYLSNHEYDKWTYEVVREPKRLSEIVQDYIDKKLFDIGFDGEWIPAVWNVNEVMTDFSFCCIPDHSIVVDLAPDLEHENKELLDALKPLFEHPLARGRGWNAKVDIKRLVHRGFKFHDDFLDMDGMIATALIDSRHGKGLDVGVYNYTNIEPYWVPMYEELKKHKLQRQDMAKLKHLNPDVWFRYCAGDGISHFNVNGAMKEKMKQTPLKVQEYFKNVYLPSMWYIIDMEIAGLPVDLESMEKMTVLYKAAYEYLREKLLKFTKDIGMEEYNPHYWSYTNELLFDRFNLDPAYFTKKTKGKSRFWYAAQTDKARRGYKPSTNAKGLGIMYWDLKHLVDANPDDAELKFKLEVLKTQIDLNKLNPMANKMLNKEGTVFEDDDEKTGDNVDDDDVSTIESEFVANDGLKTSYWNATGLNNRIYTDVFPCLDNFRWSTKPNTQVMPAKTLPAINKIFKELEPELKKILPGLDSYVPDNMRNIIYGGHPDWVFLEADCLSADLGHVGYLSNDEVFLKAVREKSFHVEMAKKYFQMPNLTKEEHPDKVIFSKTFTFNSTYTSHFESAAYAIQGMIYGETGQKMEVEDIAKSLYDGWGQYPNYMKYKAACEQSVRDKFYIENAYGMRLTFEPSEDFGTVARYINRALAWPVASSMALHMTNVATNLRSYFKYAGEWQKWIFPVNSVHDAHYLIAHKDMLKDNYLQSVIADMFSKVTPISTGDFVGVDMVIADRWKGKKVIYEGKTKWKDNQWVLTQTGGH